MKEEGVVKRRIQLEERLGALTSRLINVSRPDNSLAMPTSQALLSHVLNKMFH